MRGLSVQDMADEVASLMADRLRIGGQGLAGKLARSRGMIPKPVRAAAQLLAEAEVQAQNPKLFKQLDHVKLYAAYDLCLAYLQPLGQAERRRGMMIGIMGSVGLVVLLTFALVVGVLRWRGYL